MIINERNMSESNTYKKIDYDHAERGIKKGDTVECLVDFMPAIGRPKLGHMFSMHGINLKCTKVLDKNRVLAKVI